MPERNKGRHARNKGKAFERRIARELRESGLCPEAKRGFQTRGGTAEEPDVKNCGRLAIECKAHKKVDRPRAYRQAVTGAKDGEIPILVYKDDYQPPMVRMDAAHLPALWLLEPYSPVQGVMVELLWEDFLREILPRMIGG